MYSNRKYDTTNTPQRPNRKCFTAFSTWYIHQTKSKATLATLSEMRNGVELVYRMDMNETQWQELTRLQKTIAIERAVFAMVGESINVKFTGGNAIHASSWEI